MFLYKCWKFAIEKNASGSGLVVKFVTPTGSPGTFSSLCFRTEAQAKLFMHRYIDHLEGTGRPPVNLSALLDGQDATTPPGEPEPQGKPEKRAFGANAAKSVRLFKDLGTPLQKWWPFGTATSDEGASRMSRTLFSESND